MMATTGPLSVSKPPHARVAGAFHVGSVSRGNLEETGMIHRRASSPGRGTRHSRFVFLLSVFTLVVSLMMPMLTLTASDAAAQGTPPNCDQGYVVSDDGTECVPADQQQQDQQQPQCAEGEVLDPNTNACVPATEPPQQASAYLQIAKFDCPPVMDWSQATYQDLQQKLRERTRRR